MRWRLLVLTVLAAVFPAVAAAQFRFVPYDGIPPDAGGDGVALTDVEFPKFCGLSRCLCDQAGYDPTLYLAVYYDGQLQDTDVYFYLGNDCDSDAVAIDEQCHQLAVINLSDFDRTQVLEIPVNYLVDPDGGVCEERDSGSATVYAFVGDKNGSASATYTITFDTKPPGAPEDVEAVPGEEGVTVSWSPPESGGQEVEYYAVLCMTSDGSPVGGEDAPWVDTLSVCNAEVTLDGTTTSTSTDVDTCPQGAVTEGADPYECYVCAVVTSTTTSVRVSGLSNGTGYVFSVVAVDEMGNVSPQSATVSATPEPTVDFAEHYRASGGQARGDYCFVATGVFGDIDNPVVRVLRLFRDRYLLTNAPGRAFVAWYYAHGRPWGEWVHERPAARALLAVPIALVAVVVAPLVALGPVGFLMLLLAAWGAAVHMRRCAR